MGKSAIEWTGHTWNPIIGCSVVSPGCTNCYAMKQAERINRMNLASNRASSYAGLVDIRKSGAVWTGEVKRVVNRLDQPLRRKKPTTYFVNSMGDLFHEDVPDHWIDQVFSVMVRCPRHKFQVLTKRAERMREYASASDLAMRLSDAIDDEWRDGRRGEPIVGLPLDNVWLGVSVEDQRRAETRIPALLRTPAAMRWISAEPLLGFVDLTYILADVSHLGETRVDALKGSATIGAVNGVGGIASGISNLDWIVCGGESGDGFRPLDLDHARELRDQCAAAGVPFFFKQVGGATSKSGGALLDGQEFQEMPTRTGAPHTNAANSIPTVDKTQLTFLQTDPQ